MKITARVRTLNFFRNVFRIRFIEKWLVQKTLNKTAQDFVCRFVPNPYQYKRGSWRTIHRNGISMMVDVSDYIGHVIYFGFKDPGLDRLFSLCQSNATVLDVGSNIGWTLLNLSRRSIHGKAIGFEPDPVNFELCKTNLDRNQFQNVVVYPIGLGESTRKALIETRSADNRGGNRVAPSSDAKGAEIEILKMDDFLSSAGISAVNLIKIDVEGYELKVLRGAEKTLRSCNPILFIEIDENNLRDQGDSAIELMKFLYSVGYTDFTEAVQGISIDQAFNFSGCHFDMIAR